MHQSLQSRGFQDYICLKFSQCIKILNVFNFSWLRSLFCGIDKIETEGHLISSSSLLIKFNIKKSDELIRLVKWWWCGVVCLCLFNLSLLSDPMPRNCKLFFDWQEDAHIQQGGLGDLISVLVSPLSLSLLSCCQ